MDKQQLAEKATETLRPFETQNLMETIQNMSLHQIFSHPVMLIVVFGCFFYGIIKRSTSVLLSLFFIVSLLVIMRYLMPAPGQDLTLSSLLPFIGAGLVIGCVVIYFSMVKS